MALTVNHPLLKETVLYAAGANVTSTTTPTVRCPFRGKIVKVGVILGGAITAAPLTVTSNVVAAAADGATPTATLITHPTISVSQTNSAAGSGNGVVPTANNTFNEDDSIQFIPAGATGASTPVTYYAVVRAV